MPIIEVNNAEKPPVSCPAADVAAAAEVGNPINALTGAKKEYLNTGVTLGGIALSLTYDTTSKSPAQGDTATTLVEPNAFGALWRSSFHHKLQVAVNLKSALLSRGDGRVINFDGNGSGIFTAPSDNSHKLVSITGGYRFTDTVTGALETFDSTGKLTSIAAADGTVLTFTYSAENLTAVRSNDGRLVRFAYANGLITQITAADRGTIAAAYDANKNLVSLTWQDGKVFSFLYENSSLPWALTGKVDENNSRYATFGYDSEGRAISTEYAGAIQKYSISYASPPVRVVGDVFDSANNVFYRTHSWMLPSGTSVRQPNGQSVAIDAQLVAGTPSITSKSQPAGSGCAASASSIAWDSNGNVLSRDDFQGNRSCYAHDSSNREIIRVEGLATSVACSSVTAANATLPTGARKITTSWHPDWRLPVQRLQPGLVTRTVYHGQSDPFNNNAIASCTTAPNLPNGKPLPVVCKQVQQASTQGATDFASAMDPNFDSVRLLMHMDGANNSTTFTDSSASPRTVTASGTAKISTAQSKFGGSSVYFDGTASCLSSSAANDWSLGAGDFTVELWYNPTVLKGSRLVTNRLTLGGASGTWGFNIGTTGISFTEVVTGEPGVSAPFSFSTGVWYHLVALRDAGTLKLFVNGVEVARAANLTNFSNQSYSLNVGCSPSENYLNGYIDDLRITRGVSRYAGNFLPPSQPYSSNAVSGLIAQTTSYNYDSLGHVLTSVDPNGKTTTYAYYTDTVFNGTYDPYIDNVSLLLHGNGADNSTSIIDDSPVHQVVTVVGDAKIGTAQSKFGGSSVVFDGVGDYITIAPDSLVNDFTIEGWFYLTTAGSDYKFLFGMHYGASYLSIRFGNSGFGGRLQFGIDDTTLANVYSSQHTQSSLAGGWHHVAFSRSGGIVRAFLDGGLLTLRNNNYMGTAVTSWTDSRSITGVTEAYMSASSTWSWLGYIDDFRITNGVARYTANFTPPTQEFLHAIPNIADTGHTVGDLQGITNPAGQVTQFNLYDPAGRVRQVTDPKGVVTDITYTPRGWVSTVTATPPGSSSRTTTYTYDGVGQVTGVVQPDGTSLTYSYDAAHRLAGATDARGNSVTYTLDDAGNRVGEEVRDPTGTLQRSISRSFDAINRLQQVTGAPR